MKRAHIVLCIPVEDDEDAPSEWDWATLIDSSRAVVVLDMEMVDLLPGEEEQHVQVRPEGT